MTAQINEMVSLNGHEMVLLAVSSDSFYFDPRKYGLKPVVHSTACWSGYVCDYAVEDNKFYIKTLKVNCSQFDLKKRERIEPAEPLPEIYGIKPEKMPDELVEVEEIVGIWTKKVEELVPPEFEYEYRLNHVSEYTGKIILGDNFNRKYYEHMGYQQLWAYNTLYELEFKNGELIGKVDFSSKVDLVRRAVNSTHFKQLNDFEFIRNSFSRTYEDKVDRFLKLAEKGRELCKCQ